MALFSVFCPADAAENKRKKQPEADKREENLLKHDSLVGGRPAVGSSSEKANEI